MKLQLLVTLFAATAAAYSPPVCKSQPSHCKYANAAECRKLISQGHFELATCQAPARTVTSTRTVTPTHYVTKTVQPCASTKKVSVTTTKKGKPTKRPVKTVTAYTTKVATTTQVYKSTKTLAPYISTITKFAPSSTTTTTSTSTVTSFVDVEYSRPECKLLPNAAPDPRKRSSRYKPSLPKECADCFLTTTKGAKPAKTVTATKTKPTSTHTIYKKSHKTPTVTRKVTVTRYGAGPTQPAPEYTKTITEKKTQTSHSRSVVTTRSTSFTTTQQTPTTTKTTTTTTTKIVERTAEPCANVQTWLGGDKISGPVDMVTQPQASNPTECCRKCYSTADCLLFKFSTEGTCEIGVTWSSFGLRCEGNECPRGFVGLSASRDNPDGASYYGGKCGGGIQR